MPDCRTEYLVTRNKQFFCMTIFFLFLSLSVKSQTVSVADFLGDRQAAVSLTFDDGIQEALYFSSSPFESVCTSGHVRDKWQIYGGY